MRIVALTTCHNRCEITLRALQHLVTQRMPDDCELEICVVDDASTDGTAAQIAERFPSIVVIHGSGDLYWAGGMRYGWQEFAKLRDFDFLLVLNDDIVMIEDAVAKLLEVADRMSAESCSAYAVAAAFRDPNARRAAYGGAVRCSSWHPLGFRPIEPTNSVQRCDTLNMNLALISRGALDAIGFLSCDFKHGMADYDFGLRLRSAGGRIVLAPGYFGECHGNTLIGRSEESGIVWRERWRRLTSVKEQPLKQRAAYYRRHAGWLWPVYFVMPYAHVAISHGLGVCRRALRRTNA